MIIRVPLRKQACFPVTSLLTKLRRKALTCVLALLTLNTLYGCSIVGGDNNPVVVPPLDPVEPIAKPAVSPDDSVVDVPEAAPDDSIIASTQIPTGPIVEARCDLNSELGTTINSLVDELTGQEIPYTLGVESIGEWRDCSGIFLRFSSALAESCPILESQLVASAGVKKYTPGTDNLVKGVESRGQRSTRTIADWYHSQGGFTPVEYASPYDKDRAVTDLDIAQLVDIRNRIKVGSVLWFSRHKPQSGDDIQALFNKHINHMGVVTKVVTDENGVLQRYEMFHGHGKRNNLAKRTIRHYWEWAPTFNNHEQYPPLGYWTQYLVGIAPVFAGHTEDITLSAN